MYNARLLLASLMLAVAAVVPLHAQAVEGRVTAAEDGSPVAGARILLLDAQGTQVLATTATDAVGQYRVEAPAAGTYILMVERAGYANQISSALEVGPGEPTAYHLSMTVQEVGRTGALAADSLDDETLLGLGVAEACRGVYTAGLHAILFGAVRNSADSEPLPFVEVEARWEERGMGTDRSVTRSDEAGAYVLCDVPAGRRVQVRALERETDLEGASRDVTLRAGTMRKLDVPLPLSDPNQPGNLLGRVVDADGRPLVGAEVRLVGAGRVAPTNERGVFVLEGVQAGTEILEVEMMGYATQREGVRVVGGRAQELTVRMATEPVELAPILVTVRPRTWFIDRRGLEDRIALGMGFILLREDIEERSAQVLGELMRDIPGVRVRAGGGGLRRNYVVQMRGASNLENDACQPMVWVDGVKWGTDGSAFTEVMAFEIEAVEVFRGPAEVPGEYAGSDSRCGVVVVWTRRGRTIGG
ncbi:MAG TPA: carboxypeptidase regulatory-like domain-containing protein [Longimicrobiales bacterium]|nr:carboxypeptidase regulatory-like domain-containing protein [Longimicrobiales bacterium]